VDYLPWWAVSAALGAVPVAFWLAERRPFGFSGVIARFANLAEERAQERERAALARAQDLEAMLLAATAEAAAAGDLAVTAAPAPEAAAAPEGRRMGAVAPLAAHAVFLAALAGGGLLARVLLADGLAPPGPPDAALVALLGEAGALLALLAGGALVGFGTALAGGCTGGHGLTGCGRLVPASLVATAAFFGAGVAVSFLVGGLAP
jgi:uncharacterized membrane protein YedE/YeeE